MTRKAGFASAIAACVGGDLRGIVTGEAVIPVIDDDRRDRPTGVELLLEIDDPEGIGGLRQEGRRSVVLDLADAGGEGRGDGDHHDPEDEESPARPPSGRQRRESVEDTRR